MAGQMKRKGKKGKVKTVEVKWKGEIYRAKPTPSPPPQSETELFGTM